MGKSSDNAQFAPAAWPTMKEIAIHVLVALMFGMLKISAVIGLIAIFPFAVLIGLADATGRLFVRGNALLTR